MNSRRSDPVDCGQCRRRDRGWHMSEEGLCTLCEAVAFPSRFHNCPFCGCPQKGFAVCRSCRNGCVQWMLVLFSGVPDTQPLHTTSITTQERLAYHCQALIRCAPSGANSFPIRTTRVREWPGLRNLDGCTTIPDPNELRQRGVDVRDYTWRNGVAVLRRELERLGVFLWDEIQYRPLDKSQD